MTSCFVNDIIVVQKDRGIQSMEGEESQAYWHNGHPKDDHHSSHFRMAGCGVTRD